MRRGISVALFVVLAGCGSTALQGTLAWQGAPRVQARSLSGTLHNTTSHSVTLDPKQMRLLDDRGRRVAARIRTGTGELAQHATTGVTATWRTGKPVRIDYGSGTLALPSP